eukprot:Gb_09190 [translate_table: standard]
MKSCILLKYSNFLNWTKGRKYRVQNINCHCILHIFNGCQKNITL